jgi:hypothetical protein
MPERICEKMTDISREEFSAWEIVDSKIQRKSMELLKEYKEAGLPIDGISYLEYKNIGDGNIEFYGEWWAYGGSTEYWYSIPARCLYDNEYKLKDIQSCFDYIEKEKDRKSKREIEELEVRTKYLKREYEEAVSRLEGLK